MSILIDALRSAIGPTTAAYAIAALGLNLQFGYAGLLNLGQAGFMALGAYGLAVTVTSGGGFFLGIVVGVVLAVLFGLLLALPTVRLRADYLAIATIAAAEILRFVLRSSWAAPVTNGVYGLQRFADSFYALNPFPKDMYALGPVLVSEKTLWLMCVSWVVVGLVTVLLVLLIKSPWGRIVEALREDEDLARSMGKNVYLYKVQVLVIGGVLGGLAGMLLAIDQQNVNPDNFGSQVTFFLYIIVIIGGIGRLFTPIVGAIVFWLVLSVTDGVLRSIADQGVFSWFGAQQAGVVRYFLVGAALVLMIIFRPQGILTLKQRKKKGVAIS